MYRHCSSLVDSMNLRLRLITDGDRQDDQALADRMVACNLSQSLDAMLASSDDHANNIQTGYDDYLRAGRACNHYAALLGDNWPDDVFELCNQLTHCQRITATEHLQSIIKEIAEHVHAIHDELAKYAQRIKP